MSEEVKRRRRWIDLYLECRDAGRVCRRRGISRPTLRKWVCRFLAHGDAGLISKSRRPRHSPARKLMDDDWTAILRLRGDGLGARRIQGELRLHADRQLSLATIHKVLKAARVKPLVKAHRPTRSKRYSRSIPGECVQMDTMKVVPGVYQYTAIDDCSRFRVLGVYPRRSGRNTLLFLDRVVEEMPFPIQRMQTDRGTEFFAEVVQKRLQQECIKFRPIPPRSPHLNDKVERSQLTDLIEFWSRHSPQVPDIAQRIEEWQFDYNWRRSHGSLSGRTPVEAIAVPDHLMPMREDVSRAYEPSRERIRFSNWKIDQAMAALHRDLSKPKANSDAS